MASGESNAYELPYPLATDPVNVHGDIRDLVQKLEAVLPLASYSQIAVSNNTQTNIQAGDPVYVTGYDTATTVARATSSTTEPILGLAKTNIAAGVNGIVVVSGVLEGVNTSSFSVGDILYAGEFGGLTKVQDPGGAVGIVLRIDSANGLIVVEAKGNGTWGALKAGLA
jgi:hypothetical protein